MHALLNGFWVFVGIVAGAFIQFGLHWLIQKQQQKNAKRVFLVEVSLNRTELDRVEKELLRKKERFGAGQNNDFDFLFDFSSFNYKMIDPLINSGHFHSILGAEGVTRYFQFARDLNVESAKNFSGMLQREHQADTSLSFLDWMLEIKLHEWRGALDYIASRLA